MATTTTWRRRHQAPPRLEHARSLPKHCQSRRINARCALPGVHLKGVASTDDRRERRSAMEENRVTASLIDQRSVPLGLRPDTAFWQRVRWTTSSVRSFACFFVIHPPSATNWSGMRTRSRKASARAPFRSRKRTRNCSVRASRLVTRDIASPERSPSHQLPVASAWSEPRDRRALPLAGK